MRSRDAGRTALAVLTATVAWAAATGAARAAAPWTPGPVHGNGVVSYPGDVAVSPDGGSTVVWTERPQWDSGGESIGYAQCTPPAGLAAPALRVSPAGAYSVAVRVAATASGTTLVLAAEYNDPDDDHDDPLRLTTIAADGSAVGSLVAVDELDALREYGTQLAVDDDGDALVTWIADDQGADRRLYARRIAADGMPGPILDLDAASSDTVPQAAFAPDGTARVAWLGVGSRATASASRAACGLETMRSSPGNVTIDIGPHERASSCR